MLAELGQSLVQLAHNPIEAIEAELAHPIAGAAQASAENADGGTKMGERVRAGGKAEGNVGRKSWKRREEMKKKKKRRREEEGGRGRMVRKERGGGK